MLARPIPLSPEAAAAQEAFERLAAAAHPDPLSRPAFTEAALDRDVDDARAALRMARQRPPESNGKAARLKARKDIKQASQALNHAEAALVAEQRAEHAAPRVQRINHMQDGVTLREPRVEAGPCKRLSLVDPLNRLCSRGSITTPQKIAGHRYRRVWEMAGVDAFAIGSTVCEGSRPPPASGNWRVERAAGSSVELDRLRCLLGAQGTALVEHVVVHELDVGGWAARHGINAQLAMGMLLMALNVLVERRSGD